MELIYNEKDITEDVRILRAEYECFLGEHADRLTLTIDSSDEATSGWGFAPGDTIKLKDPDTGKMFVYRIHSDDDETTIYAASIPQPEEVKSSKWKKITFKKLVKDLASSLGYSAEFHGTEDPLYEKVEQKETDDLSFLVHRCALEGCVRSESTG